VSLPLGVGEPVVTHVRRQTDRQAHTHTHTHTPHTDCTVGDPGLSGNMGAKSADAI
jgi:hypothetical protein